MTEKLPYLAPEALVFEVQGVETFCGSYSSEGNESLGFGNSYDENDY